MASDVELPWLMMLPKDKEEDPDARDFFSLSKQKIFTVHLPEMRGKCCCGSFQNGWLMTVDIDLNISLFHPWSKNTLQLPHLSTFKHQNYVGVGDEGAYTIEEMRACTDPRLHFRMMPTWWWSSTDLEILPYAELEIRSGTEIKRSRFMEDVVYHNGQFYALSPFVGIYLVRTSTEDGLNAPCFEKLTEGLDPYGPYYLVPDIVFDSMFVIIRDEVYIDDTRPHILCNFEIYKAHAPVGEGRPIKN